ncbi:two-component system response regulator MprA [Allonocardiopsis opalescens]|uniref:Two-component system response regulator MprA n=2 Tax=Allonocardiopsis opalescens TaxID=1144618 RepID=A0A2T0Q0A9_9ACTN|nr:two-component system response regulator MprA [Allonocardiopsis opalescens]
MRILVADDDAAVRASLTRALRFNGYEVDTAADGQEALDRIAADRPDALVLDIMMPRLDGLGACRRLRAGGDDLPVLMLTARDALGDRVAGLDAGADDYLPKPFELDELLARLRALLRRARGFGRTERREVLEFADLALDVAAREVTRAGRPLQLTRTEFDLLEFMMRHPRQVLSKSQLLEEVWGYDFGQASNSLEVYIGYLRRKTEEGGLPRLIHTVRGVGYALRRPDPSAAGGGRRT